MAIGYAKILRRFMNDAEGAIAVIFSLTLVVLLLGAGLAIDYVRIADIRGNLRRAADAAALAAVAKTAQLDTASETEQIAHSQSIAVDFFKANPLSKNVVLDNISATVTRVNGELKATLDYTASVPMIFGSLLGRSKMAISDTSSAAASTPKFIDVYVLVDASTSMGIGADAADQTIMLGAVGCTFACHASGTHTTARAAGATLRFDVIKSAINDILTTAGGLNSDTHVRLGLYSFATKFKTEIDLTSDLAAVKAANTAMELAQFSAGTNVSEALKQMQTKVGPAGDGSSSSAPLTFVILATDGTGNATDNTDPASPDVGNWIYSPLFVPAVPNGVPDAAQPNMHLTTLDPSWCDPIKATGANMMTLETEYVISPLEAGELRFDYINTTLAPTLKANMAACATKPSFHVSANSQDEIKTAMDTLFKSALSGAPRLTN